MEIALVIRHKGRRKANWFPQPYKRLFDHDYYELIYMEPPNLPYPLTMSVTGTYDKTVESCSSQKIVMKR